jgi:hypothetical protein
MHQLLFGDCCLFFILSFHFGKVKELRHDEKNTPQLVPYR